MDRRHPVRACHDLRGRSATDQPDPLERHVYVFVAPGEGRFAGRALQTLERVRRVLLEFVMRSADSAAYGNCHYIRDR